MGKMTFVCFTLDALLIYPFVVSAEPAWCYRIGAGIISCRGEGSRAS